MSVKDGDCSCRYSRQALCDYHAKNLTAKQKQEFYDECKRRVGKIKIKGLKSTVKQITFRGEKHPSTGVVSTFTWGRIAAHLAQKNLSNVSSIRIDKDGLTIFWEDGQVLGLTPEL